MKTLWGVEVELYSFLALYKTQVGNWLHVPASLPPRTQTSISSG